MSDVVNEAHPGRAFLSTELASSGEKKLARFVMAASVTAFIIGAPYVRTPLLQVPAFIPIYEAALWISDTITAMLLFSHFARVRSLALLVLAAGYLFDSLMIVAHALSFPGVFSPTGLMGAGPQTTAWLYYLWHAGFPLFVLAYALLSRRKADTSSRAPGQAIAITIGAIVLLVVGLTALTTVGHDLLPIVMQGADYSLAITKGISPAIWALSVAVLLILWYRSVPTVLELWLMVVMLAWVLDISFSAVIGSRRYDFGFYAGRVYGLMAASFVLGVLLFEMNRLYAKVADSLELAEIRNAELVRSRENFARVQRFEAIGQLVGGVAHEFNNLLTVVTGGLELILRDLDLAPHRRRLLSMSLNAAERGAQLTQQLLTFAHKQVLRPEVVNPNEVIANLEPFVSRSAGETVDIAMRLSPVLWPARIDRVQFEFALVNLVLNARDAINGKGSIAIETRNTTLDTRLGVDVPPGDYVVVSISDAGSGMAPEDAARAFEPFFTTKEIGKGSGLGLSQVHGFVGSASGYVRIESKLGKGTIVEMYLPKSVERPAQAKPFNLAPIRAASGHETVLVVEDDRDVLDIAASGLLDLGYDVKTATDAHEALAILRTKGGIDVLFSDVVMPGGMNGAQLAVEAQRICPEIKVLLTSGYAASALSQEHGMPETLEVLRKPYRREDLAQKLRLVIGN
jgi:signal transduction histidine kinase/CheY-like chemotaxis protein